MRVSVVMRHHEDRDPDILYASASLHKAKGWVEEQPSHPDIVVASFNVDEKTLDLDCERMDTYLKWRAA